MNEPVLHRISIDEIEGVSPPWFVACACGEFTVIGLRSYDDAQDQGIKHLEAMMRPKREEES